MAEPPLLPPRPLAPLQLRSRLLPALHIARTQHQAFLRPEPRRQARDHPRRAHHDQTRRGPTPTTGPTLVVAMAAEGVLQVVVRPRQVRRVVAPKQARPVAPGHLQELLQPRPHRGLACRRRRRASAEQLHQPSPHLLRRQPLLVLEDTGHALDPFVGLPHRRPQGGRLLRPARSNCRSRLKPPGKPPARDATWSKLAAIRLSRSCNFSPAAASGGSPSSVKAAPHRGAVAPHDLRCRVVLPLPASFSALRSIGRMPRTRFFNSFLAWRSAS